MFSKACEYGIRATIYIAHQSEQKHKVSLKDVAEAIKSPEPYTSKILQKLSKNGIILSEKGPKGGFSIPSEQLKTLTLSQIVSTIDGNDLFTNCLLGFHSCNDKKPCPIHYPFLTIKLQMNALLNNTFIYDLMMDYQSGLSFLDP